MDIFDKIRLKKLKDISEINDPKIISEYNTSILQAAIAKYPEIAFDIVNLNVDLDHQDNKGQTALQYALIYYYYELVRKIIDKGANLNTIDKYGNGPLWTACLNPKRDYFIIDYLLKHGANPDAKNKVDRSPRDFADKMSKNAKLIDIFKKY